jgi:LPXTG-site transpeptidase (sortase) family protein
LISRRWWLTASALLFVGAAALGLGLRALQPGTATPPFVAAPSATVSAASPALPALTPTPTPKPTPKPTPAPSVVAAPVVARSAPLRLRIPAIKLSVPLSELGLNADGTVEVPTNFNEPGWFHLGPSPGQLGSSVILGHVHSSRGPSVFWNLGKLRLGDRVIVSLRDGVVAQFAVTRVAAYPKQDFPSHLVYGPQGITALNLVTCGGVYDKKNHRFLSNVVVYTSLVSTTAAHA